MFVLSQFVLRLSFGLSLGMALTSPRQVTSGYYRNNLYVLLGLNVLATLVAFAEPDRYAVAPPLVAALASYAGSVAWLYEKPRPGMALLWLIALASFCGAWWGLDARHDSGADAAVVAVVEPLTSGLVVGLTMAAMLLGHWYLNSPTMALSPLRKLIALMAASIVLRGIVCATGLALEMAAPDSPAAGQMLFLALRWLAGLVGALVLTGMAWQTLKIPNTQSTTGILYVVLIVTFLGELVSLMLSSGARYPV